VILSTHVIEDISYSCNDLAIIHNGGVLYRGAPAQLIQRAQGQVWSIMTQGEYPDSSLAVVSTLQMSNGIQYRVLGQPASHYSALEVQPSLEDGYMVIMHDAMGAL
jgi:ABC-2 type transport system ATP-binding protein